MDEEVIKMKKDEINQITNELKSHYYVEEFFVDPDKKFMGLLEKIIKFFEEDDFVICIKENEHIYQTFRNKYESAVDLIKTIEEEKDKLQQTLKKISNNGSYYYNKLHRSSYYEGEESPVTNKTTDLEANINSPLISKKMANRNYSISSEFSLHEMGIEAQAYKFKVEFERLKEDYFFLYEEKKLLELQLSESLHFKNNYTENLNLLNSLQIQYETLINNYNQCFSERNSLQERLSKTSYENFELIKMVNSLKESLNASEKERNNSKTKLSVSHNKIKMLEKESNTLRKKTQMLNFQIKDLKDKLNDESDDRILLERKFDEIVEELENKIASMDAEKQKILKNSLTRLMEEIKEDKCLEFGYNQKNNKIEIFFEKGKVGEVDNNSDNIINDEVRKNSNAKEEENINNDNNLNIAYKSSDSKFSFNNENSMLNFRTENTESNSPSKWKTNKNKLFGLYSEKTDSRKPSNISLHKLFSKSKSSQKSFLENCNKENVPSFVNGSNNSPNKILLGNLSSNKRTEFSKLEMELHPLTPFTVNPFSSNNTPNSNLDNCIRKTNLNLNNDNLRFVFSSNNRHKKVISLDEALAFDEDKEHRYSISCMVKKLSFLSVSPQINLQICSQNLKEERKEYIRAVNNMIVEYTVSITLNNKEPEIIKDDCINLIKEPEEVCLLPNPIPDDELENDHYVKLLLYLEDKNTKLNPAAPTSVILPNRNCKREKPKSNCLKCMIL